MNRAVNVIVETPEFDPNLNLLLIYRNECDTSGEDKWRVACYGSEEDLIQDLMENPGPAFPAIQMRIGLVSEVNQ